MLDSKWNQIDWRKTASLIPLAMSYLLLAYVSRLFIWEYVPDVLYKDEPYCVGAIFVKLCFYYLIFMSYAFLTLTFMLNPGYLPRWLRVPTIDPGSDPKRLLRIYNARLWVANKILSFDEFIERDEEQ